MREIFLLFLVSISCFAENRYEEVSKRVANEMVCKKEVVEIEKKRWDMIVKFANETWNNYTNNPDMCCRRLLLLKAIVNSTNSTLPEPLTDKEKIYQLEKRVEILEESLELFRKIK